MFQVKLCAGLLTKVTNYVKKYIRKAVYLDSVTYESIQLSYMYAKLKESDPQIHFLETHLSLDF